MDIGYILWISTLLFTFIAIVFLQKRKKRISLEHKEIAIIAGVATLFGHVLLICLGGNLFEVVFFSMISAPWMFMCCFVFIYIVHFILNKFVSKIGSYRSFISS